MVNLCREDLQVGVPTEVLIDPFELSRLNAKHDKEAESISGSIPFFFRPSSVELTRLSRIRVENLISK